MSTPEFWRAIEAVHVPVYFSPDAADRYLALGLADAWMGYVASRSAALGTPGPELVTATFHGFAPGKISQALPEAWTRTSSTDVLAERLDIARGALAPVVGGADLPSLTANLAEIVRSSRLRRSPARRSACRPPGGRRRPRPAVASATVMREYHGDAHVAVLTASGIDGATAHALAVATGLVPPTQQQRRGWDDRSWDHAYEQAPHAGLGR